MKTITILGSTGSIGTQTLDIVRKFPDRFKVFALTANRNIDLLMKQIEEFKPTVVGVTNLEKADELASRVGIPVYEGEDGLSKISRLNHADTVVNALVGSVGVIPTIEAIKHGRDIALANKETLVTAGSIVMELARKNNASIMPIDSEHSAIFQCLNGERAEEVSRIILTCSGGPFRQHTKEQLDNVTVKEALNHPTWKMGGKITVDSATLMNKGLEVIEAFHLYNIVQDKIDVVIHPQSTIHSMVEFIDGSIMAQLSMPDMRIPIQYALSYPGRLNNMPVKTDISALAGLTFEKPDTQKFPCLEYAYEALRAGGTMPAAMNAANEVAVRHFIEGRLKFSEIPSLIKNVMDSHKAVQNPELDDIMDADKSARKKAEGWMQ